MYDFAPASNATKAQLYDDLLSAAKALTQGEPDAIANMANVAALIWQFLPDLNWAGFYRVVADELVLGPFVGKPACIRIAIGQGVCGTAVSEARAQRVDDVHAFPGHIACDADSRSELVLPIIADNRVVAVIDLDSPLPARFDAEDEQGMMQLAALLGDRMVA
ncbi:GAF domain-containing protein [Alterisphingorhabdus coralli]|uniref:GAF domain-containing protein n=1 Tax=Alterisphingorhabdus coralli TaxID=3071408 RepID=A0AA97F644_9SPHN|nr:GAF domain-containing protein [Parasphingorhabdus sp. SCSIO 66989]WOE75089.1 GAF domain-containing protein [Parasphingorhabdus sp. SCSIO 66989]